METPRRSRFREVSKTKSVPLTQIDRQKNSQELAEIVNNAYNMYEKKIRDMENERITEIEEVVCAEMDVDMEKLKSKSRKGNLPTARFMCWMLIKEKRIFKSLTQIAIYYGKQQHCTVIHGIKSVTGRMEMEKDLRNKFNNIKTTLKMNEFNNTHQIKLALREQDHNLVIRFDRYDAPVEIDGDGEINSEKPIPRVKENKIEPMDDCPIFYTTTLNELADVGYIIEFIPIKK